MDLMGGHKEAIEIPNGQSYVTPPSLKEVFRDAGIGETVERWLII
jgi:hypothetical protein